MEWASGNVKKIANSLHAALRVGISAVSSVYMQQVSTQQTDHVESSTSLAMELTTYILLKLPTGPSNMPAPLTKPRKVSHEPNSPSQK